MDLVDDIRKRDDDERDARQHEFDETRLIAAHNGDVFELEGFQVVRVQTLTDLFKVPVSTICLISDEDSKLAELITLSLNTNGCNFAQLTDIPGQVNAFEASKWLATFKRISFVDVMADIADQRMIEDSMTKEELQLSMAKKQHAQRARKDGEIRPLVDFDRVDTIEDDLDVTSEV